MKPVEIILKVGRREIREDDVRDEPNKMYYKHEEKCYKETPGTTNIC
jgi:hypothetical protein